MDNVGAPTIFLWRILILRIAGSWNSGWWVWTWIVLFLYFFLKHLFLGWAQLSCEFCQGFTGSCESRSEIQFLFLRCLTGKIEILRRCKRHMFTMSCPGGSDDKECAYNAGYLDLVPGSGRSPGERNGNPLQYSCLGNPMDRGDHTWDHIESNTAEWLTFSLSLCLLWCQILIATSSVHWDGDAVFGFYLLVATLGSYLKPWNCGGGPTSLCLFFETSFWYCLLSIKKKFHKFWIVWWLFIVHIGLPR